MATSKKRRHVVICLVGIGVVIAAVAAFAVFRVDYPITRDQFNLIRDGMTLKDVEDIMGFPPGDYSTGPTGAVAEDETAQTFYEPATPQAERKDANWFVWASDNGYIDVYINESGKVDGKSYVDVVRTPESISAKLSRYLGQ